MLASQKLFLLPAIQKELIEDHFDQNHELEKKLFKLGNNEAIQKINRDLFKGIKFTYVKQESQRGLGDAVLQARHLIEEEAFAILLADDLIINNPSATQQLIDIAIENESSVLGLNRVPQKDLGKYGVVASSKALSDKLYYLEDIVEKPLKNPPSDMAVFGRYILSHNIFKYLENLKPGFGGEIQLTDAIKLMLKDYPVAGYLYDGHKFDCGSKVGYVKAIQHLASQILDD